MYFIYSPNKWLSFCRQPGRSTASARLKHPCIKYELTILLNDTSAGMPPLSLILNTIELWTTDFHIPQCIKNKRLRDFCHHEALQQKLKIFWKEKMAVLLIRFLTFSPYNVGVSVILSTCCVFNPTSGLTKCGMTSERIKTIEVVCSTDRLAQTCTCTGKACI